MRLAKSEGRKENREFEMSDKDTEDLTYSPAHTELICCFALVGALLGSYPSSSKHL